MSLFCIVWSKNSHRTCISVCTSALSEQLCRVCAEARYEKALNTHTHARSHAHTLSLSVSFWNTDANTHCPSPLCKHTHPQMLSHRQTDAAPFGHIFSLLCQGVLADLPLFECSATLVCVCLCVCVWVSRGSGHMWSPKSSYRTCLRVLLSGSSSVYLRIS